jgi:hypothetical protein
MALRSPQEMRDSAKEFREMASQGADIRLQAALLLVAEEFDREAERLEGMADDSAIPSCRSAT